MGHGGGRHRCIVRPSIIPGTTCVPLCSPATPCVGRVVTAGVLHDCVCPCRLCDGAVVPARRLLAGAFQLVLPWCPAKHSRAAQHCCTGQPAQTAALHQLPVRAGAASRLQHRHASCWGVSSSSRRRRECRCSCWGRQWGSCWAAASGGGGGWWACSISGWACGAAGRACRGVGAG
jgi:hypothetical protein